MEPKAPNKPVRLLIAKDGSSADLVLPERVSPDELTYDWCLQMLQEASVVVTAGVTARVRELLESYSEGTELRGRIAEGTPVVHGTDGFIEWEPGLEPAEIDPPEEDGEAGSGETPAVNAPPAAICFYSRSAFVMVSGGQRLGRLVQPTDGTDGCDVRGHNIAAKAGKPLKVKFDESVMLSADGVMTAQNDGVLSRSREKMAVREYLEVPGNVDFSTGHIDFHGDVKILKGVRDLFEVRATGNIEIGQLIEAAVIEAGGDIFSTGGMAGRDRGRISAKGDLTIRYMDSTQVSVGGVLRFEREMINCTTDVRGSIESPGGSIIGGETTVVGKLVVAALGSNSQVATTIHAGGVPVLESKLASLEKLVVALQEKEEKMGSDIRKLTAPGRVLTGPERERQTELSFELQVVQTQRAKCEAALRELGDRIQRIRTVDISVEKMLHGGVRIAVLNQIFRISKDIKGPLRILLDQRGAMVYRVGTNGRNTPLRQISEIRAAAA